MVNFWQRCQINGISSPKLSLAIHIRAGNIDDLVFFPEAKQIPGGFLVGTMLMYINEEIAFFYETLQKKDSERCKVIV